MKRLTVGDVVRHTKKSWSKMKGEDIICEVTHMQGQVEYATKYGGAWFNASHLKLVRKASKKSLAELSEFDEEEE